MLKSLKEKIKAKHIYLVGGFLLGVASSSIFFLFVQEQDELLLNENIPIASDLMDTLQKDDYYLIDSIEVDEVSEDEEGFVEEIAKRDNETASELLNNEQRTTTVAQSKFKNTTKKIQVNDVKNIARTLKGSSISAKTIIHEVNRIITQDNNAKVTGATIAEALSHKLPRSTKNKLIKNVDYMAVSDKEIYVKLKNASNIKLTFKTDEGKKTIKVYDGAKIKINNYSSKVTAKANGFSYQHLGMLWQIKNLIIQETSTVGTLDIQLKGKLKDVDLPTITLGNLYRKIL